LGDNIILVHNINLSFKAQFVGTEDGFKCLRISSNGGLCKPHWVSAFYHQKILSIHG